VSKVRNKCVCAFNLSRKNVLSYESTKVLPKYFRTKVLPYFRARSRAVAASNDVKLRLDVVSTKVQSTFEGTFESTFVPSKVRKYIRTSVPSYKGIERKYEDG